MDIKNYFLKKKQVKAIRKNGDGNYFANLPFHCPKCNWGTDVIQTYIRHLENHLKKKKNRKWFG